MDDITLAVKEMYEKYPYPSGEPKIRSGFDLNLLLSSVKDAKNKSGIFNALDAGCGRGVGLISASMLQPHVNFVGADINRTALAEAKQNAECRGLKNICFVEADLMTLEGIDVPPGGFDVIYSSGVLHHLSDPEAGLKNLEKILAPHGVISLMVYGSYGRQALYRFIEGIDLMMPEHNKIEERLPYSRLLSHVAGETIFKGNYWEDTCLVNDVEFVDRCLNVNETSYDIASLWQLIENAGMKFVRWDDPEDWSIDKLFKNEVLVSKLNQLESLEQFKIIERLFERPKLELIISKNTNEPSPPISRQGIEKKYFSVNPEISFSVEKRNLKGFQRIESISYKLKAKDDKKLENSLLAQAALLLLDQNTLFTGKDMADALMAIGASESESLTVLIQLLELDIIYCPHNHSN